MVAALVASCLTIGAQPFIRPDNACTPGEWDRLTVGQVCTSKTRPALSAADRRRILVRYGYDPLTWTGGTGELDHRIPFYLGGRTTVRNVWPEPNPRPVSSFVTNRKDRLEDYTRRRVCGSPTGFDRSKVTMRVRTAVLWFRNDWVVYSRAHGL